MSQAQDDERAQLLSPEELERFCEYLYRRTGMTFGESKRYYVDRRVAERMRAVGASSFQAYFGRLRSDDRELERAINAFTVNETYFYREEHQLRCLSASLLPAVIAGKQPGDKIRIWSNPCSTGEEAYSIAIWLLENWGLVDAYNIEIAGSDLDTQALEEARIGLFGARAVSRLHQPLVDRYFESRLGGGVQIIQDLRDSVSFSPVNLMDRASMASHGAFEIIFCRNVLIYFDEASRRTAAETLFDSLRPGGFLLLGHTESMARIDDRFEVVRFEDAVVYQRPMST